MYRLAVRVRAIAVIAGTLWHVAGHGAAQDVAAPPIDAGMPDTAAPPVAARPTEVDPVEAPDAGASKPASPASAPLLPLDADGGRPPSAKAEAPLPTRSAAPAQSGHEPRVQDGSYTATALVPGLSTRIELDKAPSNVQQLNAAAIQSQHGVGLHDALNARLGSATINDVQNNPLQPDLQYRGFTASPLLGTPQGIAIYQNGVRINEPFGDVLQWDLIPVFAIGDVELLPGANPLYGLNALGGSLVLRMKDGFRYPGMRAEALAGSFGRYQTSVEFGKTFDNWAVYAGGSIFGEQGFRDKSPSSAQNVYADIRERGAKHEVGISLTYAHSDLTGNGPAPVELLAEDRNAVYTWPDNTRNELLMLSIDAKRQLAEHVSVHGTAYFRHGNRGTSNGDEAEFTLCDGSVPSVLCDGDGRQLRDEAGRPFVTDDPYNAVFNTTQTVTDGIGGSLLIHVQERFAGRPNHLVVGATFDGSRIAFLQQAEVGWLTLDRGVQGIGVHLEDPGFHTDLAVQNQAVGVYATDTWTPVEPLSFNLSARMNWLHTKLNDRLGSALDGSHGFVRVNPSIGLTYRPVKPVTFFANYAESNRAPSAAELSCADPTQPCRVPNAFISDPALEQVVSRSLEVGLRGRVGPASHPNLIASLAAFGSRNEHDILFVAGSLVGTGYFQNAGRTQRIGLEASLQGDAGPCQWYATYTLLRATFESELELPGGANPAANSDDAGDNLEVETGSRIPGLPTHTAKAGLSIRPVEPLQLGLEIHGQSSQPLRGDEANALRDVHGFMIVSAHASYQLFEQLELFLRARNILDTKYSTFGVVADPSEVLSGASNPRFLGVGAPFGIWGGIVVTDLL